jgi:hypothetical protein
MHEANFHGDNLSHFAWVRWLIQEGQPIETMLKETAQEVDTLLDQFKEDLEAYSQCIKNNNRICI